MIRQFTALYRARKDPKLAKRLASEMIVDGAIDKASWPIVIAKCWMSAGIVVIMALILMFLLIGMASHWILAIPTLPLAAIIYGIVRLWRGINAGAELVRQLVRTELGDRAEALIIPSRKTKNTTETRL